MKRQTALDEFRYGKRSVVHAGDFVRVRGGGSTYQGEPTRLRGVFLVAKIVRSGRRTFLDADRVVRGAASGRYTLLVGGPAKNLSGLPGWVTRPYRIQLIRKLDVLKYVK